MNSVAIRTASAFESAFRIAQPPMTSLLSVNGPSVTVILPPASRTRTPSLKTLKLSRHGSAAAPQFFFYMYKKMYKFVIGRNFD
jgi:hypothetical protein